jgi:enamine deaminase RidA (YjgF/YER057c/UK114 family)
MPSPRSARPEVAARSQPADAKPYRSCTRKTRAVNEIELAAGLPQTPNYRYADVIGDRLFIAGQVPLDASGTVEGAGQVAAQAALCLANLFTLVDAHGFGREDIHQLTIYVVGPHQNLLDAWATIVRGFDANVPPATLLGVQCLGFTQQLVELDARVERNR